MKEEEQINELQFIRFPFLGTRQDGEPFAYLLMDLKQEKATILISRWMVAYTLLNEDEKVDLFIPNQLTTVYDSKSYLSGVITKREDKTEKEHYYEITFEKPFLLKLSEYWTLSELSQNLPADVSLEKILLTLIKDSLILKQGILVYLRHLIPYFSRLVDSSQKEYQEFNKITFLDIVNKIKKKEKYLEALYFSLKTELKELRDVLIYLNLDELREAIETEIDFDLFFIAFSTTKSKEELVELMNQSKQFTNYRRNNKYMTYFLAIKELEKRLYSNYNQIILIYLRGISQGTGQ